MWLFMIIGYLNDFPRPLISSVLPNYPNAVYQGNLVFISAKFRCSLAVMIPAKCDWDSADIPHSVSKTAMSATTRWMPMALFNPTLGMSVPTNDYLSMLLIHAMNTALLHAVYYQTVVTQYWLGENKWRFSGRKYTYDYENNMSVMSPSQSHSKMKWR